MNKGIRFICILLMGSVIFIFFEPVKQLLSLKNVESFSDGQIGNIVAMVNVILAFIIGLHSFIEKKREEERCQYSFTIAKNYLGLGCYSRVPLYKNEGYEYNFEEMKNDISYYGFSLPMVDKANYTFSIPLEMDVSTKLIGDKIRISNVRVLVEKNGYFVINQKIKGELSIEESICDKKKFLIRFALECDHKLEKLLLNNRIFMNFRIVLTDDRGKDFCKYYFLEVQNVMGEKILVKRTPKRNRISCLQELVSIYYYVYRRKRLRFEIES